MGRLAKIMMLTLALALWAAACSSSSADGVYEVRELGFKLSLPDGPAVITQSQASHSEKQLAETFKLRNSLKNFRAAMTAARTYLYAFSSDRSFDMCISDMEGKKYIGASDFSEVDDETLRALTQMAADLVTDDDDFQIQHQGAHRAPGAVFSRILISLADDGQGALYVYSYLTVHDYQMINIDFSGPSPEALEEQRPLQEKILDSLVFD